MDCIYLTNQQIAALYKLTHTTRGKALRAVGVQLRGNADAQTAVVCDSIPKTHDDVEHAVIEINGQNTGWSC